MFAPVLLVLVLAVCILHSAFLPKTGRARDGPSTRTATVSASPTLKHPDSAGSAIGDWSSVIREALPLFRSYTQRSLSSRSHCNDTGCWVLDVGRRHATIPFVQILRPLAVPWQVSPSVPYVKLLAVEQGETSVSFIANFLTPDESPASSGIGFTQVAVVANPYENPTGDRIVKIEFKNGIWCRMSPSFSNSEVLDPRHYNFGGIPCPPRPDDIECWIQEFRTRWLETGYCPDPCAYAVENSEWIREIGHKEYEHFIVTGHDAYAEIIATDWQWSEVTKSQQSPASEK